MEQGNTAEDHFSSTLIALMKGVVYGNDEPVLWQQVLELQTQIRDYIRSLGLELVLFEDEGFAFLRTRVTQEGETALPRLIARRQLSYPVSLLLALLRRALAEHDAGSSETRLILERETIVDMMRTFLNTGSNEAKMVDAIDRHINKVIELGFARRLRGDCSKIEVLRILKAFIDAQWLQDFNAHLAVYQQHGSKTKGGGDS